MVVADVSELEVADAEAETLSGVAVVLPVPVPAAVDVTVGEGESDGDEDDTAGVVGAESGPSFSLRSAAAVVESDLPPLAGAVAGVDDADCDCDTCEAACLSQ